MVSYINNYIFEFKVKYFLYFFKPYLPGMFISSCMHDREVNVHSSDNLSSEVDQHMTHSIHLTLLIHLTHLTHRTHRTHRTLMTRAERNRRPTAVC